MEKQLNQRKTIYRTAAKLFFTKGYHATGMREIARIVKLKEATLYYYYPSKQSLLYEIIKQGIEDLTANVYDKLESAETTKEKIHVFLTVLVRHVLKRREDAGLLHEMRNLDRKQQNELRQLNSAYIDTFRRILDKGIEEKVIRPCDTKFKAILVLSNAVNLAQWYRRDGSITPDEIAEIFVDQAVHGLFTGKK